MATPLAKPQKISAIAAVFDAHGGPGKAYQIPPESHRREPTPKGEFVIAYCAKQASSGYGYGMSKIPWGSKIRLDAASRELQVQLNGQWKMVKDVTGVSRQEVEKAFSAYYRQTNDLLRNLGKAQLTYTQPFPDEWIFNDFGHISCYYFVDVNGNRRQDKGEKMSQEVVHPTPDDEFLDSKGYGSLIQLPESHGCIHVKPKDIDYMIARGFLKTGNTVVVHGYTDVLNPARLVPSPHAPAPYEVHFYPASKKLVVYGWETR